MTNDLKKIIKEELDKIHGETHYIDTDRENVDFVVEIIINKVLDLVEKEVEKIPKGIDGDNKKYIWESEISTIITNLRPIKEIEEKV